MPQRTYLLVADDPALLSQLRSALEPMGATVVTTQDALEARRLAATVWPDVILTADIGPGAAWLRTLPQPWMETVTTGIELPSGVRAFAAADQP